MIRFRRQFEMAGGVWRELPKGRLRIRQLLLALLGLALLWWIIPSDEEERIEVTVAVAQRKDMPVYLDIPGVVQAYQMVTVQPQAEGQLAEILFEEGQDVHAGDVLAKLDPRHFQTRYDEALATQKQDEAMLAKARSDLERARKSGLKGKALEAKRAVVQQFEASVKSDEVAATHYKNLLSNTVITAPIDGRVGIRQVDAGNMVRPSDLNGIVVITQLEPISVLFSLPQKSLLSVMRSLDKHKVMPVLAIDAGTHTLLDKGELEMVDSKVDPETGTVKLKAAFTNKKRLLWPGAKVLMRLLVSTSRDALVVPMSSIQPGQPKPSIFVYRPSSESVEMRPIKLGLTQDNEAVIEEGVKAGEQVVTDSMKSLQQGSPVIVRGSGAVQE